jgi:hypothetical protein
LFLRKLAAFCVPGDNALRKSTGNDIAGCHSIQNRDEDAGLLA